MAGNIVEEWLRSLNLVNYTLAFFDNGYDDLEICKQIGEADLDAIGVFKAPHRKEILRAVQNLREQGGTAVYFTLENPDDDKVIDSSDGDDNKGTDTYAGSQLHPSGNYQNADDLVAREPSGDPVRVDEYELGKIALLGFPKLQLRMILRDKLVEDDINLAEPPYTLTENLSGPGMEALCHRYAAELKTFVKDVREALEEHRQVRICIDASPDKELSPQGSPTRNIYNLFSIYGQSLRSVPPPLPSCPPPSRSYADPLELEQHAKRSMSLPGSPRSIAHSEFTSFSTDMSAGRGLCCLCTRMQTSVVLLQADTIDADINSPRKFYGLGKFFKNVGIRRSGRKYTYKKHEGDLLASEITMSDEDRILLMLQVKEGKITMDEALEKVKQYESERLSSSQQSTPDQSVSSQHSTPDLSRKVKQEIPHRRKTSDEWEKSGKSTEISTHRHSAEYTDQPVDFAPDEQTAVGFANHHFIDGALSSSPSFGLSTSPGVLRSDTDSSTLRLASSPGQSSPLHIPSRKNSLSSGSSIHSPMEKRRSSGGSSPSVHSPRRGRSGSQSSCSSTRSSPQHQPNPQQQPHIGAQQLPRPVQTGSPVAPPVFSTPEHRVVMGTGVHGSPSHRTGVGVMTPLHPQQYLPASGRRDDSGHSDLKTDTSSGKQHPRTTQQTRPTRSHVRGHTNISTKTSLHSPFEKRRSLQETMSEPTVKQEGVGTHLQHHHHERQISSDTSSDRLKEIDSEDEKNLVKSRSISCDKNQGSRSQVSSKQTPLHTFSHHSVVSTVATTTVTMVTDSSPEHSHVHTFTPGSDSDPSVGLELYVSGINCTGHSSPMVAKTTDVVHSSDQKVMVNGKISGVKPFSWQRSGSYSTEDGLSSDADDTELNTHEKMDKDHDNQDLQMKDSRSDESRSDEHDKPPVLQDKLLKQETSHSPSQDPCSGSSQESMHSVTTSSSGARSSLDDEAVYTGPFIGIACVHTECHPVTESRELLNTKKGDIIHIIKRSESGLWKGLLNNKIGFFKLSHVDLLPEESCRQIRYRQRQAKRRNSRKSKPKTVEELLQRLGLQHLLSIFLINGCGKLETFSDLDPVDLTELNITDAEERAKILTAVELLQDDHSMGNYQDDHSMGNYQDDHSMGCESPKLNTRSTGGSTDASSQSPNTVSSCDSPQPINTSNTGSRDSGCYASHENLIQQMPKSDNKEILESQMANEIKKAVVTEPSLQGTCAIQSKILQKPVEVNRKAICSGTCEQDASHAEKGSTTENGELTQEDEEVISITIGQAKTVEETKTVTVLPGKSHPGHLQQNGQVVSGSGSRLPLAQHSRKAHNAANMDQYSKSKQKKTQADKVTTDSSSKMLTEATSKKRQFVPKPLPQAVGKISLSPKHGPSSPGEIRRPPPVPKRNSVRTVHLTRQESADGSNISSSSQPSGGAVSGNPSVEHIIKHSHVRTQSLPETSLPEPSSRSPSALDKEKISLTGDGITHGRHHQRRSSRSLETMVLAHLEKDGIDLTRPAHSEKTSTAALVPWLVQRYAALLQRDTQDISVALESVRSKQLRKHKTAEQRTEERCQDTVTSTPHRCGSLSEFLHAVGLPVYTDCFLRHGYHTVDSVRGMREPDLKHCGVHDPKHIKKLLRAVESLRSHPAAETSSATSRSSKLSGVKDKV